MLTVHSLEPLRPWKREQLGGGYDFSCWVEKTAIEMADAVIAVSQETKADMLRFFNVPEERIHIIYNGIDLDEYKPVTTTEALEKYGIDPKMPYVLFVGRITRQKGIVHLVNAIKHIEPRLPDRALRRRAGHAGDRRGDESGRGCGAGEPGSDLDSGDGAQIALSISFTRTRLFSAARPFTNRSASSISKRWRAKPLLSRARSAGSRKSSSMGKPDSSCRSSK